MKMKYKIDDEVLFKYQHSYNDWFVTKGIIIAYCELMTYNDNSYPSVSSASVPVGSIYGSIQSVSISHNTHYKRGPGYIVKTPHTGNQMVPESDITDVLKKEAFKKELDKILDETTD